MEGRLSVADVLAYPAESATVLSSGELDMGGLNLLGQLDPVRLGRAGVVDAYVAWERLADACRAQQARLMAQWLVFARADAAGELAGVPVERRELVAGLLTPEDEVDSELAAAVHVSRRAAEDRRMVAEQLTDRLPAALDALQAGRLSAINAAELARSTYLLSEEQTAQVAVRVLPRAAHQSPAGFRRCLNRAVLAVQPVVDVAAELDNAWAQRRVRCEPEASGMGVVIAELSAPDTAAWQAALDALGRREIDHDHGERRAARKAGTPEAFLPAVRTMDQARADAFAALGHAILTDPTLPRLHGRRPAVQVSVALSTLLALDEQPGELTGYGPIPAALARALAFDPTGTWRRLVTDPTGTTLLDCGRSTYRPPQAPCDFVLARDQICQAPDCTRPAITCDLDHVHPWNRGGTTCPANLVPLCRRHHLLRTHGHWQLHLTPDPDCHCPDPTTCPSNPPPEPVVSETITVATAHGPIPAPRPVPPDPDTPDTETPRRRPAPKHPCPTAAGHTRLTWTAPSSRTYHPTRPTWPLDTTTQTTPKTDEPPPF